jgi:hypothetical protein
MIINSDPTQPQHLGVTNTVTPLDNLKNYYDKALAWKPSKTTFMMIVGGCIILIVERKIRYKPKTYKMSFGGGKK